MTTPADLGAELARLRAQAGLTQAQLAERMGVSQARVSQIETAGPGQVEVLLRYADCCGVRLSLVGRPVRVGAWSGRSLLYGPRPPRPA